MAVWPAVAEIASSVLNGRQKSTELVKKSLKIIEQKPEYGAIISTIEDRALQRAEQLDRYPVGRLAGVPFIAKDNFLTYGTKTTAASNILRTFEAPYQASAINRLEDEGAICVAKANLDAFAHGSSTENSDWYVTCNPYDTTRVAGGSSGGSAAAVMLDMVPFALGTDTGGSIRLPASFCGAVGMKPTYGRVSRSGVVAMASSTDVVGPLAKTVADTALVLDIIAGRDILDSTTIEKKQSLNQVLFDFKGKKIGLIREYMSGGLDLGVKKVIDSAIKLLKQNGAEVTNVSLPSLPLALAVYYIVCPAEVSSNLGRYDGQRFGHSAAEAQDLDQSYGLSREQGFGPEAKRRIMIGSHVLSSGYYDAYYKKAQTVRTKIINEFAENFMKYDLLIGPTSPTTAFKIGEKTSDPLQMYLTDIMTVAANMSGNPAISVPAGQSEGLPVGLQFIGPMAADGLVLGAAANYEAMRR